MLYYYIAQSPRLLMPYMAVFDYDGPDYSDRPISNRTPRDGSKKIKYTGRVQDYPTATAHVLSGGIKIICDGTYSEYIYCT